MSPRRKIVSPAAYASRFAAARNGASWRDGTCRKMGRLSSSSAGASFMAASPATIVCIDHRRSSCRQPDAGLSLAGDLGEERLARRFAPEEGAHHVDLLALAALREDRVEVTAADLGVEHVGLERRQHVEREDLRIHVAV